MKNFKLILFFAIFASFWIFNSDLTMEVKESGTTKSSSKERILNKQELLKKYGQMQVAIELAASQPFDKPVLSKKTLQILYQTVYDRLSQEEKAVFEDLNSQKLLPDWVLKEDTKQTKTQKTKK